MKGPHQTLGCGDDIVVIKINLNGIDLINSLNFESKNIYWVYEGIPKSAVNQYTREYFVRKKATTKLSKRRFLLRSALGWLRYFIPKLDYTKNALYSGVTFHGEIN